MGIGLGADRVLLLVRRGIQTSEESKPLIFVPIGLPMALYSSSVSNSALASLHKLELQWNFVIVSDQGCWKRENTVCITDGQLLA